MDDERLVAILAAERDARQPRELWGLTPLRCSRCDEIVYYPLAAPDLGLLQMVGVLCQPCWNEPVSVSRLATHREWE